MYKYSFISTLRSEENENFFLSDYFEEVEQCFRIFNEKFKRSKNIIDFSINARYIKIFLESKEELKDSENIMIFMEKDFINKIPNLPILLDSFFIFSEIKDISIEEINKDCSNFDILNITSNILSSKNIDIKLIKDFKEEISIILNKYNIIISDNLKK